MARIATFSMRIASTKNPTNPQVAIAAAVLISAGVILLYIINLIFAQRVLRGYHPKFGNSRIVGIAFKAYFASVVAVLIMGTFFLCVMSVRSDDEGEGKLRLTRKG
jgi:cation transporter-like permease